jgi:hypothetical protein
MHTPVQRTTPFLHCLAGALVWYVAVLVGYGIAEFRTGTEAPITVVEAIVGAVALAVSATLVWALLLMAKAHIQPWLLIVIALPIFVVTWFVLHIVAFAFVVAFVMPHQ